MKQEVNLGILNFTKKKLRGCIRNMAGGAKRSTLIGWVIIVVLFISVVLMDKVIEFFGPIIWLVI